ncbi:MAG TPA: energy transducer TonB, partial [Longimicrobium sp.]|nr:energy transducer TonB [Longimicrobium sp.]
PRPGSAAAARAESPEDRALRDAIRRHYPPLMRDAGITARMGVDFTVGADGKARGVHVDPGVDPAFERAARAVVADLTFPPSGPGEEMVMVIAFLPERTHAPAAR